MRRVVLSTIPLLLSAASLNSPTTLSTTIVGKDFDPVGLNDRIGIQEMIKEKGWLVGVEWKKDDDHGGGMGAFFTEDVKAGTLIRRSVFKGANFVHMRSYEDLEDFCGINNPDYSDEQQAACKSFMTDYLFRAQPAFGATVPDDQLVYGIWVPGCGDNCVNDGEETTVEDRMVEEGVIGMYTKKDVKAGDPLLSDYDTDYGEPPEWIARFAKDHLDSKVVFAGMNHRSANWNTDHPGAVR